MHKWIFLGCIQAILLQALSHAVCPASIPPLPSLQIPTVVPPPQHGCNTPNPDIVPGYLPISIINKSGVAAEDIYIAVLVNSSTQYLSFSGTPKVATISDFDATTYLSDSKYSYPLSIFETTSGDYTFYIPNDGHSDDPNSHVMRSSRILISLKHPLTYFINHNKALEFPSEFDTTNDNYYILNDKIEFDLGSNGLNRLNLNLTGVDFFGLPLLVQANYKFLYGINYQNCCGITGMPSHVSLRDVFTQYENALGFLNPPFDDYWRGLVATYTNPSSGSSLCKLRIFAPATVMKSTQSQSDQSKVTFPSNYFLSTSSPSSPCTWFNAVWSGVTLPGTQAFYQNRNPIPYLILDATTKYGDATAKGYEASDGSFTFLISRGPDDGKTVIFPLPTSSKAFFTGAVNDYLPAVSGTASDATKDQLLKVFATSIISGFLPIDCNQDQILINQSYVQQHSSGYFENNPILDAALTGQDPSLSCPCVDNIPWYDFYSRTLLTIGAPNLFYTSAYSDFLGSDGTIVIVDLAKENSDAYISVTLNDCTTGIDFPDPYSDTNSYNIIVGIPSNVDVQFGPSETGPFSTQIPPKAKGNAFFLKVTYLEGFYQNQSFVTQIAPLAQVFHPILPGQGKIFPHNGSGTIVVNIGASPE